MNRVRRYTGLTTIPDKEAIVSTPQSVRDEVLTRSSCMPSSHIDTTCHTYYKIIGDLSSNSPRLVVLHGGPGTGREYLLPFSRLWRQFGIPVVFYDQTGCAASTDLPHTTGDEPFWQESPFLAELDNLLNSLQLRDGPDHHISGPWLGWQNRRCFRSHPAPGVATTGPRKQYS
ncbi:hypothetical protein PISL3812_05036 [Talaromyces islandicus]|uniref:AB hydrolase-1 domain-containing protein n=1 Tax=Talaromyces islandicus TaxID=28573 RepID=A0A0U1LY24_TALIS|nr:hypothetical protein PISL3812_05036 [Talaromyces islandicus]